MSSGKDPPLILEAEGGSGGKEREKVGGEKEEERKASLTLL
jgi:hypothetical protein